MNLISHMAVHEIFAVTYTQAATVAALPADAQNLLSRRHTYRKKPSLESSGTADVFYDRTLSRLKRPYAVMIMMYSMTDSGVPAAVPASSSTASSHTSQSHMLLL